MDWLNSEILLIVKKFLKMKILIVNIFEKIIDFNVKQKGKEIKILTHNKCLKYYQ